jgi:predicted transcriptional regulator
MTKRSVTVNISSIEETLARFKSAWEHAEQKVVKSTPIEIVSFENAKSLIKALSPRRLELLQQLHAMDKTSIRALAKELKRDYSNVHEDVKALYHVGLVLQDDAGKYYMPWDKVVTEIPMTIEPIRKAIKHEPRSRMAL